MLLRQRRVPLKFYGLFLFALAMMGCTPTQQTRSPAAAFDPGAPAASLRTQGAFAAAGAEYQRIALSLEEPTRSYLLARSADAYLDAPDLAQAATVFSQAAAPNANSPTAARDIATYNFVKARLDLVQDRIPDAMRILTAMQVSDLPDDLKPTYWGERAIGHERMGNLSSAVVARLELDRQQAGNPTARSKNARRQWILISQLTDPQWEALAGHASADLAGWRELRGIVRADLGDAEQFSRSADVFRNRYPTHPALLSLLDELKAKAQSLTEVPTRIAVLLPTSSKRYGKVASAVRDGIFTAYFGAETQLRPEQIKLYDVIDNNAAAAYQKAVADGAQFVIGPLTKASIANLIRGTELGVPTLVLNHVDAEVTAQATGTEGLTPTLYQFGLVPEDEAKSIAADAWQLGYRRAITMAPLDDWGQRVSSAFTDQWIELGGKLIAESRFVDEGPAYSKAVASALGLEQSKARAAQIKRAIGRSVEFTAMPRPDIDFLFVAARPTEARQIMPQLRYFQAQNLPVLATSHVYQGIENPRDDGDLDGLRFTDMPWMFGLSQDPAADAFKRSFNSSYRDRQRLFAFGVDAYRLISFAPKLKFNSISAYDGVTGRLSIDGSGYVHREPMWGRFGDGRPSASNIRRSNIGI